MQKFMLRLGRFLGNFFATERECGIDFDFRPVVLKMFAVSHLLKFACCFAPANCADCKALTRFYENTSYSHGNGRVACK